MQHFDSVVLIHINSTTQVCKKRTQSSYYTPFTRLHTKNTFFKQSKIHNLCVEINVYTIVSEKSNKTSKIARRTQFISKHLLNKPCMEDIQFVLRENPSGEETKNGIICFYSNVWTIIPGKRKISKPTPLKSICINRFQTKISMKEWSA